MADLGQLDTHDLTWRSDLIVHRTRDGCVVEDPVRRRFFEIGIRELEFAQCFGDSKHVDEEPSGLVLPIEAQQACLHWMLANQLVVRRDSNSEFDQAEGSEPGFESGLKFHSLMFIQWTLGSPDALFRKLAKLASAIPRPALASGLALLWTWAVIVATNHGTDLWHAATSLQTVFAPKSLWMLACAWLGLKITHELAHGITCRLFGAEVRSWGIGLMFFAPVAFVDVTAAWRLTRLKRVAVTSAGVFAELCCAAIAMIIWSRCPDTIQGHLALRVAWLASVGTLLFNLNPLMKFDGYYLLSDLIGYSNLWSRSRGRVQVRLGLSKYSGECPWWMELYGWLSVAWTISVISVAVVLLSRQLAGAGILLAIWFAITAVSPILRNIHRKFSETGRKTPVIAYSLLLAIFLGVAYIPLRSTRPMPAVVEYSEPVTIRPAVTGFVQHVYIRHGDAVQAGDVILQLVNLELAEQLAQIEFDLQIAVIEERALLGDRNLSEARGMRETRFALRDQRDDLRDQMTRLKVVADADGCVDAPNLSELAGQYVQAGDSLGVVGVDSRKRLRISFDEDSLAYRRIEGTSQVWIRQRWETVGTPLIVASQFTRELPHAGLGATNGGPLAVRAETSADQRIRSRLVDVRIDGFLEISPDLAAGLGVGEKAFLRMGQRQSIADMVKKWLTSRTQGAT
jgi:putative peptide zinc metalloprotease protein